VKVNHMRGFKIMQLLHCNLKMKMSSKKRIVQFWEVVNNFISHVAL